MTRRALITGVAGQDGSYLVELLLSRGYEVHGTLRPTAMRDTRHLPDYIQPLLPRIRLHPLDLSAADEVEAVFRDVAPDECYHLGGPSAVDSNISGSATVFATILESTRAILKAMTSLRNSKLFFAGSSEIFGNAASAPQTETSLVNPRSVYGLAKLAARDLIARQRRRHALFACTGLLYNHESPRRPPSFLPRKVTLAAARIALGRQDKLRLGNLAAERDWGYAPDFVEAAWRILQAPEPDDFIIATGTLRSVNDLVETAFKALDLDRSRHVEVDMSFFRPAEVVPLQGDPSRLTAVTGWRPTKHFQSMIIEMVRHDYDREKHSSARGF